MPYNINILLLLFSAHRLSSAYHPKSNGRAEVSVKSMKRLMRDNVGDKGELDTDAMLRGLLQFRNTTEPDSGLSSAMVLLGRALRDTLPFKPTESAFQS